MLLAVIAGGVVFESVSLDVFQSGQMSANDTVTSTCSDQVKQLQLLSEAGLQALV